MAAAMVLFSALCILIGVFPETFYKLLPYSLEYEAYNASKVVFYLRLSNARNRKLMPAESLL